MLKNRERMGISVDKALAEAIRALSKKTRIDVSKLMDEAIEDLLKKYEVRG